MRIALVYPPPWKIAGAGDPAHVHGEDGPPPEYKDGDLDADFYQIPYGLFALGAQAIRAGHQVKVLNLSAFAWSRVEQVLDALEADLYGMSCWTANRRGVALAARHLRKRHPKSHILVGGPHASPLAVEMLTHYPEIDTVAQGESDVTFLDLIARLEAGRPTEGTPGTVYRKGGRVEVGPNRASVEDLD